MYPRLYQRKFLTCFCAGMIVFSVVIRLATAPAALARLLQRVKTAAGSAVLAQAVLFLEAGIAGDISLPTQNGISVTAPPETNTPATLPDETAAPVTDAASATTPPVTEAPTEPALCFSPEEAEQIEFRGNCSYTVDKTSLLLQPLNWQTPTDGPQVLIVHSHTCESYTPTEGYEYTPSGDYRTLEDDRNVIAVGKALAQSLEENGISVIHDTTYHDYPSYNSSYANSRQTIESYLEKYPSIVMVIDLHRDAAETVFREVTEMEGEECALLMLVIGTDEGGLYHPGWKENLSCALKLQALGNRIYPSLFKKLAFRAERFNQDETPASMIVEVGSTGNSLPEAVRSAKYFGDVVATLLLSQQ